MVSHSRFIGGTILLLCMVWTTMGKAQEYTWQPVEIGEVSGQYGGMQFLGDLGWVLKSTQPYQWNELWLTQDGGTTWSLVFSAPAEHSIYDAQFLNPGEGWLVLGVAPSRWTELFRTQDGGKHWESIDYDFEHTDLQGACCEASLHDFHFFDAQEGLAHFVFYGAVLLEGAIIAHTEDGGKTWRQGAFFDGQLGKWDFVENSVWATNSALMDSVLFSADKGRAWDNLNTPMGFYEVDMINSYEGWGIGVSSLQSMFYKTQDEGKSWIPVYAVGEADGPSVVDLLSVTPDTVWLLVGGWNLTYEELWLLHTEDGGEIWLEEPLPIEAHADSQTSFGPSLTLNANHRELWVLANGFTPGILKAGISAVVSVSPQGKLPVVWGALK